MCGRRRTPGKHPLWAMRPRAGHRCRRRQRRRAHPGGRCCAPTHGQPGAILPSAWRTTVRTCRECPCRSMPGRGFAVRGPCVGRRAGMGRGNGAGIEFEDELRFRHARQGAEATAPSPRGQVRLTLPLLGCPASRGQSAGTVARGPRHVVFAGAWPGAHPSLRHAMWSTAPLLHGHPNVACRARPLWHGRRRCSARSRRRPPSEWPCPPAGRLRLPVVMAVGRSATPTCGATGPPERRRRRSSWPRCRCHWRRRAAARCCPGSPAPLW